MHRVACVLSYIFFFYFCIKSDVWYPVYLMDGIKLDSFCDDLHVILLYYSSRLAHQAMRFLRGQRQITTACKDEV